MMDDVKRAAIFNMIHTKKYCLSRYHIGKECSVERVSIFRSNERQVAWFAGTASRLMMEKKRRCLVYLIPWIGIRFILLNSRNFIYMHWRCLWNPRGGKHSAGEQGKSSDTAFDMRFFPVWSTRHQIFGFTLCFFPADCPVVVKELTSWSTEHEWRA